MKSLKQLLSLNEASISGASPDRMGLPYSNTLISSADVKEKPSGSNYGPEINRYLKTSAGLDNEKEYRKTKYDKKGKPYHRGYPWCMAFVYTMFDDFCKKLNLKNPLVKGASVLNHWDKADPTLKISVADARREPSLVRPGQIFFLETNRAKYQGHTGIVTAVNVANGTYETIEGNTDDKRSREGHRVGRNTRKLSSSKLLGFVDYFKGNRNKKFEETIIEVVANAKGSYTPPVKSEKKLTKEQIKEVQRILKKAGYNLGKYGPNEDGIDGYYGKLTKDAVLDWKSKNGMEANKVLDTETYKKIVSTKQQSTEDKPGTTDTTPDKQEVTTTTSTAPVKTEVSVTVSNDKPGLKPLGRSSIVKLPKLMPNKQLTIDNFNISKDSNYEIKTAIVESSNSVSSLSEMLNENFKLRDAIRKIRNFKKKTDTALADRYRGDIVSTSPTDVENDIEGVSSINVTNILSVKPEIFIIHNKTNDKYYIKAKNQEAIELLGSEDEIELSKEDAQYVQSVFTDVKPTQLETAPETVTTSGDSIIFSAGLDNRSGDLTLKQQTMALENTTGMKVSGYRYNDKRGFINAIKEKPNSIVVMFSAGNQWASLAANASNNKAQLYMIEPYNGGPSKGTHIAVNKAVKSGVPSKNVIVGSSASRGRGILDSGNGTPTMTPSGVGHWGSLKNFKL